MHSFRSGRSSLVVSCSAFSSSQISDSVHYCGAVKLTRRPVCTTTTTHWLNIDIRGGTAIRLLPQAPLKKQRSSNVTETDVALHNEWLICLLAMCACLPKFFLDSTALPVAPCDIQTNSTLCYVWYQQTKLQSGWRPISGVENGYL